MSLPPPDYHTSRTIGTGQSNPADVRRLRRTLSRLGYARSGNPPAENVTPGLMQAIERFQSDFGLEPDSVIRPGGPTERALTMALRARNKGGESALPELRDAFTHRAAAGLTFEPDPHNRHAGRWRDKTGQVHSAREADAIGGAAPLRGRQIAMMSRRDQLRRPGQNVIEGGGAGGGGRSRGRIDAGTLLRGIFNQIFQTETSKTPPQEKRGTPSDAKIQAVPIDDLRAPLPPFPAEPPGDFDGREEFPAEPPEEPDGREEFPIEERKPTILVSPRPEEGKPEIEIFPDQSNLIERWFIQESRGAEDGQRKDLQYLIDGFYRRLEKLGLLKFYEHKFGGYTYPDEKGERKYKKERVVKTDRNTKVLRGSRRPDFSYTFDGVGEDLNVVDTLADNVTPTKRERDAFKGLVANKERYDNQGATRLFGKSKGMTWEEYTKTADEFLDILVDELRKRILAR